MRLHVLSDLHLEFGVFDSPQTDADVVVLAGDIHIGRNGRAWIRQTFRDKPVVYVLGNHEYYRNAIPVLTDNLQRESEGSHIHLLERSIVEIGDFTFLGCTLWTDFKFGGNPEAAKAAAEDTMSDYKLIRVSPEYRRLRASDTARFFALSVQWLKEELSKRDPARVVIVTHHAPSPKSNPAYHLGSELNPSFVSDLNEFIEKSSIPLWVHGHTHYCCDYQIGRTRILSNQRGYPDAVAKEFVPDLIIQI
jgi:predicted phosphodiesterase